MSSFLDGQSFIAIGFIGQIAVRALESLFAAGMVGSAIVVVITFIEDLHEVIGKHDPALVRPTHEGAAEVGAVSANLSPVR